jgi:Zn-dependent alcohol dehydrogenase
MQGLVWDGTALEVADDLQLRAPGDGEVRVDIRAAGLCHSDLKPMDADTPQPLPVVLGHEAVGIVTATGPGVRLRTGDRVVLSVLQACGRCRACRNGQPTLCRDGSAGFTTPFERDGKAVHQFVRLGAFAQQTVVREGQAIPVPAGIPDTAAALLGCAVITAFGAVEERARVRAGDKVLVIGAGGIGLNVVQAARLAGAELIAVADTNPRKEAIARRLGATDVAICPSADEIEQYARKLAPEGFDAVFECVGRSELLSVAIAVLAFGGRAVIVGLPPTGTRLDLEIRSLFHDQALLGCRMGGVDPHTAIPRLAELYLSGQLELDPLVTKVVPLAAGAALVDDLRAGLLDRGLLDVAGTGVR